VVSCFRLSDGQPLWSSGYPAPFVQDPSGGQHGRGPFATPAVSSGRLFTVSVTNVLHAWDASTGKQLWKRDGAGEFSNAFPYFGAAGSPLVWRDLVFTHLGGHRRGNIETPGTGAVVALRVSDGREAWRWTGDGPAVGSSPILCEFQKQTQLVYETKKHVAGLDPASGRELWRIPYPVAMDNTIATPVCLDGRLIMSDYDAGFRTWLIENRNGTWTPRPSWHHRDVSLFTSSPVPAAGYLAGFSHMRKGQLFLLNPHDGKVVWRGEPRAGEHATLIARGRELLVFSDAGTLLAGPVEREAFRPAQRYRLGGALTWAHPALAGEVILYRSGARLIAFR
jgi:outer membrane protein assembly factor BamB